MTYGRFIVIEGLDGTGKSTLARALAEELDAEWMTTPGRELADVRAHIDDVFAHSPEARYLFYTATVHSAAAHARRLVAEGRDVVCDRYWFTTLAYAELGRTELPLWLLGEELLRPDLILWLDAPDAVREERIAARGTATAIDHAGLRHSALLRGRYADLLDGDFARRVARLDARGTPAELLTDAMTAVSSTPPQTL